MYQKTGYFEDMATTTSKQYLKKTNNHALRSLHYITISDLEKIQEDIFRRNAR